MTITTASPSADDLLAMLACPMPECGGGLATTADPGVITCMRCEAPWPVLAGVPVLVPNPGAWLAAHRESVLACLAECGAATPAAVDLIDTFAEHFPGEEALRFGDDWTAAERAGAPPPIPLEGAPAALGQLLDTSSSAGPEGRLDALLGEVTGTVLEVGPGAGGLSVRLAPRCRLLVVADLSLRAVLVARDRTPGAFGLVADASWLPLRPGTVDAVVAANVFDLLDDAEPFLDGAAEALADGGLLALSAPEDIVIDVEAHPGFVVEAVEDAVPWIRAHDPRHYEMYLVQVVAARLTSP